MTTEIKNISEKRYRQIVNKDFRQNFQKPTWHSPAGSLSRWEDTVPNINKYMELGVSPENVYSIHQQFKKWLGEVRQTLQNGFDLSDNPKHPDVIYFAFRVLFVHPSTAWDAYYINKTTVRDFIFQNLKYYRQQNAIVGNSKYTNAEKKLCQYINHVAEERNHIRDLIWEGKYPLSYADTYKSVYSPPSLEELYKYGKDIVPNTIQTYIDELPEYHGGRTECFAVTQQLQTNSKLLNSGILQEFAPYLNSQLRKEQLQKFEEVYKKIRTTNVGERSGVKSIWFEELALAKNPPTLFELPEDIKEKLLSLPIQTIIQYCKVTKTRGRLGDIVFC